MKPIDAAERDIRLDEQGPAGGSTGGPNSPPASPCGNAHDPADITVREAQPGLHAVVLSTRADDLLGDDIVDLLLVERGDRSPLGPAQRKR